MYPQSNADNQNKGFYSPWLAEILTGIPSRSHSNHTPVPSRWNGCLIKALLFTHQPWLGHVFRPSQQQPDLCRSCSRQWAGERLLSHPSSRACFSAQECSDSQETVLAYFPLPKGAAGYMWNAPASTETCSCQERVGSLYPRMCSCFLIHLPHPRNTDAWLQLPAAWPLHWWFCIVVPSPLVSSIQCFEEFCVINNNLHQ